MGQGRGPFGGPAEPFGESAGPRGGVELIELFEYNRIAYESAVTMLRETGKAAVIHPTGTGKSFIGFRLCEDNPGKTVCWLSPSEYVYRTQCENLKTASAGGCSLENIRFYTYARLMLMTEAELAMIRPDYIILDEFHRVGAEAWGRGVARLLSCFPAVPVLGLSATNIRYLDNQRNMADELFNGNIASEMTLGEAIVRGILAAPKYVTSIYSCQKALEKYECRVHGAKSKAVRDAAGRYLEALRRALEKADGLDVVFDRHMRDRSGKYIVFCANIDAMRECIEKVPSWFFRVDPTPHVYSVYADDPSASASFERFKRDEDETHLKLLFCINALNEGIHVPDVSGVILFRPTVSPILYKQQIGRALSVSRRKEPIIFDIVNNFESLYSIGAIEQEMQIAVREYSENGRKIMAERFQILDEVRDCHRLFEELEKTLAASWDKMFLCAQAFYREHGHLAVPRRYKTEDGYSLGQWLNTQRNVRAKKQPGNLDEDRIARLNSIGMLWSGTREYVWEQHFAAARAYVKEHGNLRVKASYITADGVRLGNWISNLRAARKAGNRSSCLTPEHIRQLDELGMIWNLSEERFERNFLAAQRYYAQHGDLNVPASCVVDGVRLGAWVRQMRKAYEGKGAGARLPQAQIDRLNAIGMRWGDYSAFQWEKGFLEAKGYYAQHGNLDIPCSYIAPSGYRLGAWISSNREAFRKGRLPERRRRCLEELGMVWNKSRANAWGVCYAYARAYFEAHGHLRVPGDYKAGGIWLNKWLSEQQQVYLGRREGKRLTSDQVEALERIGMTWRTAAEDAWYRRYKAVRAYFLEYGNIQIPREFVLSDGKKIGSWLKRQRRARADGKLSREQLELLDEIGMVWSLRKRKWKRAG